MVRWVFLALCAVVLAGMIALVFARHTPIAQAAGPEFSQQKCFTWSYKYAVQECTWDGPCFWRKSATWEHGGRVCLSPAQQYFWLVPCYVGDRSVEEVRICMGDWCLFVRANQYISYWTLP